MLALEIPEQIFNQFGFRHKVWLPHQRMPVEFGSLIEVRNNILGVQDSHHFIKVIFVNGQSRVVKLFNFFDQLRKRHIIINAIYIESGTHNLLYRNVPELFDTE